MKTKEKIAFAEKRIEELKLLILHWEKKSIMSSLEPINIKSKENNENIAA